MFSRSIELIHSPPDLITSLLRSVICMKPSASIAATSPVGNQPPLTDGRPRPLEIARMIQGPAHQQVARHGPWRPRAALRRRRRRSSCRRRTSRALLLGCGAAPRAGSASCLPFSVHSVPSGDISVMPQAWMTSTPNSSSKRAHHRRRAGRAADHRAASRVRTSACRPAMVDQAQPHRRHAGAMVTPSRLPSARRAICRPGAGRGKTSLAPIIARHTGMPQALTWNIGTTGRMTSLPLDRFRPSGRARRQACSSVERWL